VQAFWRDLSYGWQQLKSAPGASAIAILSLALGIGANTVVFSWYQTLVLNPLAGVADQDRLVVIMHEPRGSSMGHSVADLDVRDLAEHHDVFVDIALHSQWALRFEHERRQQWIWAQPVSANFFDVGGVEPALGRAFDPAPLGKRCRPLPRRPGRGTERRARHAGGAYPCDRDAPGTSQAWSPRPCTVLRDPLTIASLTEHPE